MQDKRNFHFGEGLTTVPFAFSTVIGGDQDQCRIQHGGSLQGMQDFTDEGIRFGNGLVIFSGSMTKSMTGMIDVIEVNETKIRTLSR